jgi:hypothetical protein
LILYQSLYNAAGTQRRDSDGLKLRVCARGSNAVENLHQMLITMMNNMWGSGLAVTCSMLLLLCARHNERMLSERSPGHVMDHHLNFTLSSYIQKYEELAGCCSNLNRRNPNVLDYSWIPVLQMLAPEHQEAYDDVIAQRTSALSDRIHGLFNSGGVILDSHLGPHGHIITPSYCCPSAPFFNGRQEPIAPQ